MVSDLDDAQWDPESLSSLMPYLPQCVCRWWWHLPQFHHFLSGVYGIWFFIFSSGIFRWKLATWWIDDENISHYSSSWTCKWTQWRMDFEYHLSQGEQIWHIGKRRYWIFSDKKVRLRSSLVFHSCPSSPPGTDDLPYHLKVERGHLSCILIWKNLHMPISNASFNNLCAFLIFSFPHFCSLFPSAVVPMVAALQLKFKNEDTMETYASVNLRGTWSMNEK